MVFLWDSVGIPWKFCRDSLAIHLLFVLLVLLTNLFVVVSCGECFLCFSIVLFGLLISVLLRDFLGIPSGFLRDSLGIP